MTTPFSRKFSLTLACGLLCACATSIAAEQKQAEQSSPQAGAPKPAGWAAAPVTPLFSSEVADSDGNQVRFFGDGSQQMEAMRRRLEDPAQRAQIRAEQYAQLREQHADAAEALGIDEATAQKLVKLLADQQFEAFERFHKEFPGGGVGDRRSIDDRVQAQADEETRRLDALRALIGDEKMGHFQTYSDTLAVRRLVNQMDAGLASANKLRSDQKERLILLVDEQFRQEIRQMSQGRSFSTALMSMPSREEMQRQAQLSTIQSNEGMWRARKQSNVVSEQRAAQFLDPAQLTAFRRMNTDRTNELQRWILRARADAGLDANIPENPPPPAGTPERVPLAGNIQLEITLKVNDGKPVTVSHVGPNGLTAEFELGDGLSVEATTTVFEDRWLEVKFDYLEDGVNGKRRIGGGGSFGSSNMLQTGPVYRSMGNSMVKGSRKAYAISTEVSVKQL